MPHSDRLTLAAEAGAFALPEDGDVLVLRAIPSDFHALVPRERLRLAQSFRPVHDALAAEGLAVATSAEAAATGPVGLVVVHLTRSRAESLRMVAVGLRLYCPFA